MTNRSCRFLHIGVRDFLPSEYGYLASELKFLSLFFFYAEEGKQMQFHDPKRVETAKHPTSADFTHVFAVFFFFFVAAGSI
jgi:hypothetical protein